MSKDRLVTDAQADGGRSAIGSLGEFVLMLGAALLLAFLIRTFVIEPYRVPTGSMIPTIEIGDQVIVNKFVFRFRDPHQGDIVILDDPTHATPMLIKRVIAVGGQTVDVKEGKVWVDGKALVRGRIL